ncbi:FMN-dependent NADH-azoreductase [Variovorax sp. PBL-H6]|uniref:NAD(P)H-dependent oxidoreductase n=1 Tax=Variovorax sp. PBL-H6 TaxID=434009 RepID=UPI001318F25B|nr:NAD(P)H-dependent oxidoreductase [Variovorax sp. PBL-H6]VTU27414.1 FMN-dependent NADH-azoreductase [Variovorax sp. PBL-H6]
MKRAHIVYCHPEPKSFVGAMAARARASLERAGWQVTISDLYAKRFNPVASVEDFGSRGNPEHLVYSLEQRHAREHGTLAKDIVDELEPVLASELLVLAFPVFWFSVPAMLKGWFDRVLLSGTFYGGRRVYDRGGMNGRKAIVLTSLGGREHMFGSDSIHGDLTTGMLRHIMQGTLGYVGYEVYEPYVAFHVPYVTEEARREMLASLDQQITALDQRKTFDLPRLGDFDEQFKPKGSQTSEQPCQ